MNLLVVDWDYFWAMMEVHNPKVDETWVLYDWGHSETGELARLYYEAIWYTRAAAFLRRGLPLPKTTGLETTFWDRFKIHKGARLYYANSNVFAYHERVRQGMKRAGSQLWLFDAHHDAGGYRYDLAETMRREHVECEDWMVPYGFADVELHVRYPKWRHYAMTAEPEPIVTVDRQIDDEAGVDVEFHRVFVCKSGAWTPAWGDDQFAKFILDCPVRGKRYCLDGMPYREWDEAAAQREVDQLTQFMKRVEDENRQRREEASGVHTVETHDVNPNE
jgi:hypothetical protein